MGDNLLAAKNAPQDIDIDNGTNLFLSIVDQRAPQHNRRIIDKYINPAKLVHYCPDKILRLYVIRYTVENRESFTAGGFYLSCYRSCVTTLRTRFTVIGDHLGTLSSQRHRYRPADALT